MEKILVTGATGFIGNYVVKELLDRKFNVITSSSNIETARQKEWFYSVKNIPFNLDDYDDMVDYFEYFERPDKMIHLAWQGLPNYNASFHVDKNLPAHLSFITNLVSNGLPDLTVTGTCFEYGMQEGCLSEEMDTKPSNAYAIAKDTLRKKLEALYLEKHFNFKWVRLFYMYGQGQNPNSLLSQLDRALSKGDRSFNMSGGEQERDYLPVEKVAAHIVDISLQEAVTGVINCCSGKPIKVKILVENYLAAKGKHIDLNLGYYPYTDYEPMSFWGDDKKLKTVNSKQ